MRKLLSVLFMVLAIPGAARADTLDNAGVIALSRAGLGDEIIIAKIKDLRCNYDFSTASLVALRQAGVGQGVIMEMVRKCTGDDRPPAANPATAPPQTRRPPGLYLASPITQTPQTLLRSAASPALSYTGNGTFLFPYKATLTVAPGRAQVVVRAARPTFYFYFDPADGPPAAPGAALGWAAKSPEEFSLVRFKAEGNIRQLMIGRRQPGLDRAGIDPKIALPFTVEEIGQGIYRVTPSDDLEPGQYGFVTVDEAPQSRAMYRIYDFSVEVPAGAAAAVCVPARWD